MSCPSNPRTKEKTSIRPHVSVWRTVFAAIFVLTIANWAETANAQIDFSGAVDYSVGQTPDGIASGDFDADGDNDMAVVTDGPTGNLEFVEIFLNNSDGTFTAGGVVLLPNSSSPSEMIAADLDGDLDVDLAVILRDLQQVQVVTNNGAGTFSLGGTAPVGDRARGMTFGDYDFDSDIDLAVANRNDNTATVLTNNGAGVFSTTTLTIGGEPRATTFVDIDGNNDLDLAVTNNDNRNVELFTNTGSGFTPGGTISTGPVHRPEGITAADLDGNGTQDLAVAINDNIMPDAAIVFLNIGGAFGAGATYVTNGVNTSGIMTADLDCDGELDLVTRNEDSNDLSLMANLGGGVFGAPSMLATGLNPQQMVAQDFDNDGDADIAVSNRDSDTFSEFQNNCAIQVTTVFPDSFLVTQGIYVSGGIPELSSSDEADLVIGPNVDGFAEFEAKAISPIPNPSAIEVTLESSVSPILSNVRQTIELFDYNNQTWVSIDLRRASRLGDETVVVSATGDLSRFVEPGTGCIEARIRYLSRNIRREYLSNTDLFSWTISP